MLIGSGAVAVYLVAEAVDLRKSIDGLAQAVVDSLARQPVSGEVFVFGNRRRDKIKLLWWQPHGFWLAYHRLEQGRFRWPQENSQFDLAQLHLLLEGVDPMVARFKKIQVDHVN